MKNKNAYLSICLSLLMSVFPGKALAQESWKSKMQSLYITLAELLTDITTDRRFNDPKNQKQILANAEHLAKLTHDLSKQKIDLPSQDPTLQIISGLLSRETKDAVTALKEGNRPYARTILSTVPSYCVSCHTRNATGAQIKELALDPTQNNMTPFERGEFFTATRQFDRALVEFENTIKNPKEAERDHWAWRRSIQEALTIAVRVKKDPKLALSIAQAVKNTKDAPYYLKEEAKSWEKSIDEWLEDSSKELKDEADLLNEAKRLMNKARETQKFVVDRNADIYFLRASRLAHDALQKTKTEQYIGEALLMLGMCYEVLNPLRNDNLHQIYYEACILKVPHTQTSELCYRRYEENLILGFAGSSGISVPRFLRERLHRLEILSKVIDTNLKPK